jgi:glycosyltransferase involved in cell wall biosynthesis
MRILIIVPRQPRQTGNWVTADRFAAALVAAGHQVQMTDTPIDSPTTILAAVKHFAPAAVLLVHAYRTGNPWALSGLQTPYFVLPTGTDLHQDHQHPDKRAVIDQLLEAADAILLQNRQDYADLRQNRKLADKLHYLPATASLGDQELNLEKQEMLLLHPAGLRPVKGNLELLLMCDKLASRHHFQLAFCGPELDADYAAEFLAELAKRPWAEYLGVVPQPAMASLMRQADILLNNSVSEGLSNALIEACSLGRPILARSNSGNRAVVTPELNGQLFDTEQEFVQKASALLSDAHLRSTLTNRCTDQYSSDQEAVVLCGIFAGLDL